MPMMSSSGAVCSCAVERMPCSSRRRFLLAQERRADIGDDAVEGLESTIASNSSVELRGVALSRRRSSRSVALFGLVASRCRAMPRTRFLALSVQCGIAGIADDQGIGELRGVSRDMLQAFPGRVRRKGYGRPARAGTPVSRKDPARRRAGPCAAAARQ